MTIVVPCIDLFHFGNLNFSCVELIIAFGWANKSAHEGDDDSDRSLKNLYFFFAVSHVIMGEIIDKENRFFSGGVLNELIPFLHIPVQATYIGGSFAQRVVNIIDKSWAGKHVLCFSQDAVDADAADE